MPHSPLMIFWQVDRWIGRDAVCIAFVQIRLRRPLSKSLIKLDVNECCISTIKTSDNLYLFGSVHRGFETTFELQNPGIPLEEPFQFVVLV
jgi:hypothetical protein